MRCSGLGGRETPAGNSLAVGATVECRQNGLNVLVVATAVACHLLHCVNLCAFIL